MVWPTLPVNPRWAARPASRAVSTPAPPTPTATAAGTPGATTGPSAVSYTGTPTTATAAPSAASASAAGIVAVGADHLEERGSGQGHGRAHAAPGASDAWPSDRVRTCSPSCHRAMVHNRSDSRLR